MTYLLSIDPGMRTGITLGFFDDETPYRREAYWQIDGGLPGLRKEWKWHHVDHGGSIYWSDADDFRSDPERSNYYASKTQTVWVVEKFVPLPMARSFKLNELEPIRIEGAIEDWVDGDVVWQRSGAMVLSGGDTPAQRKKNSDQILKDHGFWLTGKKDLGMSDANDVNAAQKHAFGYLRSIDHRPTMMKYLMGEDDGL